MKYKKLALCALLLISCLLSLLIIEALLRNGFLNTPPYKGHAAIREKLRRMKLYDTKVVWVGDSFSWPDEPSIETVGKKISDYFANRAIGFVNLALPGTGVPYYRDVIVQWSRYIKFNLTILNYYVGNDLTDTRWAWTGWYRYELLRFIQSSFLLSSLFESFSSFNLKNRVKVARRQMAFNPSIKGVRNPMIVELGKQLPSYLLENLLMETPQSKAAWRKNMEILDEIDTVVKSSGGTLIINIFPSTIQVNDSHKTFYEELGFYLDSRLFNSTIPQDRLLEFCRLRNLKCFDLLPVMKAKQPFEFYLPEDDHWNSAGHETAFEAIRARIEAETLF